MADDTDLMTGVPEIAVFLNKTERQTRHLISSHQRPVSRLGRVIHGRKSTFMAYFDQVGAKALGREVAR